MAFIKQRFFHQRYFIGLLIGFFVILAHVYYVQLSDTQWLNGIQLGSIAINEWMNAGIDWMFINIFSFILPILCSLGPSLAITEDLQSGFTNHLAQFSLNRYLVTNLSISFMGGMLTGVIPSILDYIMALWFFPNKIPNLLINYGEAMDAMTSYGYKLYYQNPIFIVLISLSIIGVTGGIYSLLSILSGLIFKNRYFAMSSPFILTTILTLIADNFPDHFYSPVYIVFGRSVHDLPPINGLILTYTLLIIGLIGIIYYEFKAKIST